MKPYRKLKGRRLRAMFGLMTLLNRLGIRDTPDKVVARPMSVRKNKPAPWTTYPLPADVRIEFATAPSRSGAAIEIKKYLPPRLNPEAPRMFFIHGGGWISGGLDTLDWLCAGVCRQAGCLVVSVDYRLSPETPFPGGLEDCDDALTWAAGDPSLGPLPAAGLVIMGESAGANLAAALCVLRAQKGNSPIRHQTLIYPAIDFTFGSESMKMEMPGFDKHSAGMIVGMYCPGADPKNPLISPIYAGNHAGLPPALIITADVDPLRDDGARYAQKLTEAGVKTRYVNYDGMPHGFFFIPRLCSAATEGVAEIVREILALPRR